MDETEFSHQAPRLRDLAVKVSRSAGATPMESEDVAQDVLLHLWQLRDDLGRFRSLDSVVAVMARRLTLNTFRQKPLDDIDGLRLATGNTPSSDLEERENEEWIDRKLANLPSTESTILFMRQVENRSIGEIAELLGITEHSVRTLLSNARRKLFEDYKRRYSL